MILLYYVLRDSKPMLTDRFVSSFLGCAKVHADMESGFEDSKGIFYLALRRCWGVFSPQPTINIREGVCETV